MFRFLGDRRRRTALAAVALACAIGCDRAAARLSLDEEARKYVRLAVALGERDPDSLDFYAGPRDLVDDVRHNPPPLLTIRGNAEASFDRINASRQGASGRAAALADNLRAIVARVDVLRGERAAYLDEAAPFLGPGVVDGSRPPLDGVRASLDRLLPGRGPLTSRYSTFASAFVVPSDRMTAVMKAALEACRAQTRAHVSLPSNERVSIVYVRNRPWSAYSRYRGSGQSTVEINTDFALTLDQALQIACHEGYPGHHTRNVLLDEGATRAERWAQLTFAPESTLGEAAAMIGADVAFPGDARAQVLRARLLPEAGLGDVDVERHVAVERLVGELQQAQAPIAEAYLGGRLEFERAVAALEQDALVPHAEALVKYINEYRTYVSAYTDARRVFERRISQCAAADNGADATWRCYRREMVRPRLAP